MFPNRMAPFVPNRYRDPQPLYQGAPPENPVNFPFTVVSRQNVAFQVDRTTLDMIREFRQLFVNIAIDEFDSFDFQPMQVNMDTGSMSKILAWCAHHKNDPIGSPLAHPIIGPDDGFEHEFFRDRDYFLFELIDTLRHFTVPGLQMQCNLVLIHDPEMFWEYILYQNGYRPGFAAA